MVYIFFVCFFVFCLIFPFVCLLICFLAMCEDPGVPTDAQRTGDDFHDGGIVEFTCSPGLDMIGSRILLCGGGKWNATVPSCEGTQYMRLHVVFWDSFCITHMLEIQN